MYRLGLTFRIPNIFNGPFFFHVFDQSSDEDFCAGWDRVYGTEFVGTFWCHFG